MDGDKFCSLASDDHDRRLLRAASSCEVPRVFRHVVLTFTSNARSLTVLIDKKTRDKAVRSLAKFLSESHEKALPKPEMAKLWKGIFYCALFFDSVLSPCSAQALPGYWMSDKPLVQQALSSELADLLLLISSTESALAFLAGFWEAIVREWNGIDRLRMDKYYMLVRKFVNASFRLLRRAEWDTIALARYNEILAAMGGPLW